MAIHRRLRKAARVPLQALRRGREALKRRRADRRLARDQARAGLDERLTGVAAEVLAGRPVESAWELMRFGHFKGMSHEEAAVALAAWARRQGITVAFDAPSR